ncbi:hypothetical protein [Nonomuraea sp. JJY05]|uniref:hypothetical protein n=1 Tax=Nonomuraea sp. JJY05 TaxID=3350255 RepID=UPI00373F918F
MGPEGRDDGRVRGGRGLIADDQDLVRGGLAALLSLEDDIEVIAEAVRVAESRGWL